MTVGRQGEQRGSGAMAMGKRGTAWGWGDDDGGQASWNITIFHVISEAAAVDDRSRKFFGYVSNTYSRLSVVRQESSVLEEEPAGSTSAGQTQPSESHTFARDRRNNKKRWTCHGRAASVSLFCLLPTLIAD